MKTIEKKVEMKTCNFSNVCDIDIMSIAFSGSFSQCSLYDLGRCRIHHRPSEPHVICHNMPFRQSGAPSRVLVVRHILNFLWCWRATRNARCLSRALRYGFRVMLKFIIISCGKAVHRFSGWCMASHDHAEMSKKSPSHKAPPSAISQPNNYEKPNRELYQRLIHEERF